MQPDSRKVELLVYFAHSVDGPECLIYDEADLQCFGSVNALESELEQTTYWFARLGIIEGESTGTTWTVHEGAFEVLPAVSAVTKHIGRRHPAFRGTSLELHIFEAIVDGVERTLHTWAEVDGNIVEAYTMKRIGMTRSQLSFLARVLSSNRVAHYICEITILKYWCELAWYPEYMNRHGVSEDLVTNEFSLTVPIAVRWSAAPDKIVIAEIPAISKC